jgi:hypothetical protein
LPKKKKMTHWKNPFEKDLEILSCEVSNLEFRNMLSEEDDERDAILTINSGAGGNGSSGLGANADENVPAVGRKERLQISGCRYA